ncbi:MAG TPA: Asp-tRNA(Asn)/Glu-tRNA(Gln) amidotransferase subunit GatA [bacterium]|jgi:aspartyl-tRNA(Asn)/glutamyl-tRNA(Gln) amidotransferase subunit A
MQALRDVQEDLRKGRTSVAVLAQQSLDRIAAAADLNAVVYTRPEATLADAASVDDRIRTGQELPLAGLTLLVKDNIAQEGWPLTCASEILGDFISPYDATAVHRLKSAGAIVVGRSNMDEFGMGSSTEFSRFGAARNPHDRTRVAGGSSGGSAAAVAAGLCHAALGSDTGGSVRQPAAFCGVYGLKPTYGRISRYGLVAFASSLDQIGVLAACPEDLFAVFRVMAGKDPRDETSEEAPIPEDDLSVHPANLRVGLPYEYYGEGLSPEIRDGIERLQEHLKSAGADVKAISLPHTRYAIPAYYIVANAEASSNLARYDGVRYGRRSAQGKSLDQLYVRSRSEGFGDEVKRRIMLGTYALSAGYYEAYYARAQKVRRLIRDEFLAAFAEVDLILTPATPTPAFKLGEKLDDPLTMYLSDVFTTPANLAGIPALSVPIGKTNDGLPIAAQLLGPHFGEALLLKVAKCIDVNFGSV